MNLADAIQKGLVHEPEPEPEPESVEHLIVDVLGDNAIGQSAVATKKLVKEGVKQTLASRHWRLARDSLAQAGDVSKASLDLTLDAASAVENELKNEVDQLMKVRGLGSVAGLKESLTKLKGKSVTGARAGYALIPTEDLLDSFGDVEEVEDGVMSPGSAEDSEVPILGRFKSDRPVVYKSAASAADALGFSLKQVTTCCENEQFNNDFRALSGYTFKIAEEKRGTKERDPTWRVGRRKALDELENVHEINAFTTLVLSSPDDEAPSPGRLKVLVTITERTPDMGDSANTLMTPLQLPPDAPPSSALTTTAPREHSSVNVTLPGIKAGLVTPCDVIVRLYMIRAFSLTAKDAGNSSDPYVLAIIDDVDGEPQAGVTTQAISTAT